MMLFERLGRLALRFSGFSSRYVDTSAGRVHALDAKGKGTLPPAVLFHGLGASAVSYSPLITRLRNDFSRVLAPDAPAHGFSVAPEDLYTGRPLERGLNETVSSLLDRPAVVIGNSLGGFAAIRFALAHPEHVAKLVLLSPAGAPMTDEEFARVSSFFRPKGHAEALEFVDLLLAKRSPIRHAIAMGFRHRFNQPDLKRFVAGLPKESLHTDEVSSLKMPVLFSWGAHERILPHSGFEFFTKHLPSHTTIERPVEFGHAPHLDSSAATAAQIARWVRSHPAG